MGKTCNAIKESCEEAGEDLDLEKIRNVAESHLFNILFVKSCEVRRVLPISSTQYLRLSLHEVVETIDAMNFDPDKDWDDYLRDFRFTFGKKFDWDGFEIFNRFVNLYEIIHDGTAKSKDFGFEIEGFKESIFSKTEWKFGKTHKISNRKMIEILFTLNFIESSFKGRKYQQIPYSYFTARQLGSIYESLLEFKLEQADSGMIFKGGQWKKANLKSKKVQSLSLVDEYIVKKGELFFSPDNKDRKMSGSYYTPDNIVKYIIESTLDPMISKLSSKDLLKLKICDPAMGSGHFLAGAVDYLAEQYMTKWSEENLDDIDDSYEVVSRSVLDSCIYGMDLNPRAVKLAKMSLWLCSAYPGRKLENLDNQLFVGDSLDNDSLSWKKVVKNFDGGKFDCFLGNPPYLRSKNIEKSKRDLYKANYKVATGAYDIYILFYERAFEYLKDNGRIGFIVSNKLTVADYAKNLRSFLINNFELLKLVDFTGSSKVFEDAAVVPVITVLEKKDSSNDNILVSTPSDQEVVESQIDKDARTESLDSIVGVNDSFELFRDSTANEVLDILDQNEMIGDIEDVRTGVMGFEYWDHEPFIADGMKGKTWKLSTPGLFAPLSNLSGEKTVSLYKKKFQAPLMTQGNKLLSKATKEMFLSEKVVIRGVGKGICSYLDDGTTAMLVGVHAVNKPKYKYFYTFLFNSLLESV